MPVVIDIQRRSRSIDIDLTRNGGLSAGAPDPLNGVIVTGNADAGEVLTATSPTAATWALPEPGVDDGDKGDVLVAGDAWTVQALNGVAVTGVPSAGQVPTATAANAAVWTTPTLNGIEVSGTPAVGQVPTATSPTAATWQNQAGVGGAAGLDAQALVTIAAAGTTTLALGNFWQPVLITAPSGTVTIVLSRAGRTNDEIGEVLMDIDAAAGALIRVRDDTVGGTILMEYQAEGIAAGNHMFFIFTGGAWESRGSNLTFKENDSPIFTGLKITGGSPGSGKVWTSDADGDGTWTTPAGGAAWGGVTGTLSAQTDLQSALDAKVPTSRTVNGSPLSSNVTISTITGNAGTATALQTARAINGVAFDGTSPITVTAAGSTLSDTVPVAKGGTGLTAMGAALTVLRVNGAGNALEFGIIAGGDASTAFNLDQFADVTQTGTFAITGNASIEGTNTGDQTNIAGNAATVTTNANLTGPVTSTGNATAIANGAISNAMLANGAVANLSGTNTGDQTSVSGNAGTVTTNANLTGHVTSTGNAAVLGSFTIAQLNTAISDADAATLAGTETLSGKTLTAPKFADLGFVADANGNELLILDTVTSAVNELTLANAATTGSPTITATGGDTNIHIVVTPKGTGYFRVTGAINANSFGKHDSVMSIAMGTDVSFLSTAAYVVGLEPAGRFRVRSGFSTAWCDNATNYYAGSVDTVFSRISAGLLGIGTTAAGFAGGLKLTKLIVTPAASVTPASNGDVEFELTSNTSLTLKAKGSDGTVRSIALVLV